MEIRREVGRYDRYSSVVSCKCAQRIYVDMLLSNVESRVKMKIVFLYLGDVLRPSEQERINHCPIWFPINRTMCVCVCACVLSWGTGARELLTVNVNDVWAAVHVCYSLDEPLPIYHWTTSTKCENIKFRLDSTQRLLATNTPKIVHIALANEYNLYHLQCALAPDARFELCAIVILNLTKPTKTCAILCRSAYLLRRHSILVPHYSQSARLPLSQSLYYDFSSLTLSNASLAFVLLTYDYCIH